MLSPPLPQYPTFLARYHSLPNSLPSSNFCTVLLPSLSAFPTSQFPFPFFSLMHPPLSTPYSLLPLCAALHLTHPLPLYSLYTLPYLSIWLGSNQSVFLLCTSYVIRCFSPFLNIAFSTTKPCAVASSKITSPSLFLSPYPQPPCASP